MASSSISLDMSADFVNSSTNVSLRLMGNDGRIHSQQPLIINDLFKAMDEHNSMNCQISNLSDLEIPNSDFKIFYLNIRYVPNHYLELETLTNNTYHPEISSLTETRLGHDNNDLYGFDSYIHTSHIRTNKSGGKVSMFSQESTNFKNLPNSSNLLSDSAESIFLLIKKSPASPNQRTIVGIIYQPPQLPIRPSFLKFGQSICKISQNECQITHYW